MVGRSLSKAELNAFKRNRVRTFLFLRRVKNRKYVFQRYFERTATTRIDVQKKKGTRNKYFSIVT